MINKKRAFKWIFFLAVIDIIVLFVSIFSKSSESTSLRASAKAPLSSELSQNDLSNIMVTDLQFSSDQNIFQTKGAITATCNFTQSLKNKTIYSVVLKTDKEEIVRKRVENREGLNFQSISGTYTPDETGLRPVACRADFENEIEEGNERDNRLVKYIMVL